MHHCNLRFPGGLAKCLTLSYDDAVEQDIRLCQLMKQYGIAGTFNINSGLYAPEGTVHEAGKIHRRMTLQQCKDTYLDSPLIEVATHGSRHPIYSELPASAVTQDILTDRLSIEADFGVLCRGHAFPYGRYDKKTLQILEDCGIVYARTTKSTEKFDLPQNWLELHPTCHHKNPRLSELAQTFVESTPARLPQLFYLWGHTYEFEQHDNWDVIENFFRQVSGKDDIWYATNIQLCDYVRDFDRLVFSADGTTVYNPTATDLWLNAATNNNNHTIHMVPAGKTVKLV